MVTKKHFVYERKSGPSDPNTEYIMRRDPLLVLREHSEFAKPGCITLSDKNKLAIERILGNQDIGIKIRTIYRISAPVFTERFRDELLWILYDRELSVQKSGNSVRRVKTGSLETCWSEEDVWTTKHHIIASDRGWIDDMRNYIFLPEYVHTDLHRIFYIFTPIEQIAYLILLYYTPDNIEFSQVVSQLILWQAQIDCYHRELLDNGRLKSSCFPLDPQKNKKNNVRYSLPTRRKNWA